MKKFIKKVVKAVTKGKRMPKVKEFVHDSDEKVLDQASNKVPTGIMREDKKIVDGQGKEIKHDVSKNGKLWSPK